MCWPVHWVIMVLFLILLVPIWGVVSEVSHQSLSATCGESTLFQVNLSKHLEINSIFWIRHASGHKGMLAISKPGKLQVIDNRFWSRVTQQPGFSLRLSDLQEEDSGIYEAEIYNNEHTVYMYFHLQVSAKNESHRTQWTWRNVLGVISLGILAARKL